MIRDPRVNARTHAFMTLASLLTPDRVIPSMQATEHWPAIEELIDHLIASGAFPETGRPSILDSLRDREDQRSTGIGGGIAIPHAFSDQIEEVTAIIGRSPSPSVTTGCTKHSVPNSAGGANAPSSTRP